MKTLHILVSGLVQGVGYRYFVYHLAQQNGIKGWVRNLPDGQVEIMAQGENYALEEFLTNVKIGPRFARVKNVNVQSQSQAPVYENFDITF